MKQAITVSPKIKSKGHTEASRGVGNTQECEMKDIDFTGSGRKYQKNDLPCRHAYRGQPYTAETAKN